jgi:hypothetical protein
MANPGIEKHQNADISMMYPKSTCPFDIEVTCNSEFSAWIK